MKPQYAADAAYVQRLNEASEWLLRLNNERPSQDDMNGWLSWCDANPENVAAFENLQRDWHDLDSLKVLPARTQGLHAHPAKNTAIKRFTKPWALAAALAVMACAGILYWQIHEIKPRQLVTSSANKSATLPDGSSVILSTKTQVNVDFTGTKRRLDLSNGEAYFKVQHDKQRPFVVHAGDVSVTAIGTAFDVRQKEDEVVITVEEGIVEVQSTPTASPNLHRLPAIWRAEAGYQLIYSRSNQTATLASVDPAKTLRWRYGELAYVWQPLGKVIEDINSYSRYRIVLADQELAQLNFTGTVFTGAIEDWLKAIQDAYPIKAEEAPSGEITLRATLDR